MAYNPKSCNALQKPFYRPVEAAIRWCELTEYEPQIMAALGDAVIPTVQQFPKWPCLEVNTQKILDGIRFREIDYGRNGNPVSDGEQVTPTKLTVRHNDLKAWMSKHYPDAKPPFLFDETERKTHNAINIESFTALQAEVMAAKAGEKRAEKLLCEHGKSFSKLNEEFNTLKSRNEQVEKMLNDCFAKQKEIIAERDLLKAGQEEINPQSLNSLLKIVATMAISKYKYDREENKSAVPGIIVKSADNLGFTINPKTVREWLKEATSPERIDQQNLI